MTAAPAHVDAAKKAATSSEYLMEQWSMKMPWHAPHSHMTSAARSGVTEGAQPRGGMRREEESGDEGRAGDDVRHAEGVHLTEHLVGGEFGGRAAAEREDRQDHLARSAGDDLRETRGENDAGEKRGPGEVRGGHGTGGADGAGAARAILTSGAASPNGRRSPHKLALGAWRFSDVPSRRRVTVSSPTGRRAHFGTRDDPPHATPPRACPPDVARHAVVHPLVAFRPLVVVVRFPSTTRCEA